MDLIVRSHPALPARVWRAWRTRGAEYAWHKMLRRTPRPLARPGNDDWLYADPRQYWTLRGGDDYFREQEGQPARSRRAEWIAERLAALSSHARSSRSAAATASCFASSAVGSTSPWSGVDFSPTQLEQLADYLGGDDEVELLLGRGECLPFPDGSFDMVVTSAVILHNPPPVAERIRREILRVARRFAAHNEETSVELQPLRLRHRRLVSRTRDRPGRVGTDPDGPGSPVVAVLRGRARSRRTRSKSVQPLRVGFVESTESASFNRSRIHDRPGLRGVPGDDRAWVPANGSSTDSVRRRSIRSTRWPWRCRSAWACWRSGRSWSGRAGLAQPARPVGPAGGRGWNWVWSPRSGCSASCPSESGIARSRSRPIDGGPDHGLVPGTRLRRDGAGRDRPGDRRRCPLLSPPGAQGLPDARGGRVRPRPARDGLSAGDRDALLPSRWSSAGRSRAAGSSGCSAWCSRRT